MRDQYMRTGQCFLLIYSITDRSSFNEVTMIRCVFPSKYKHMTIRSNWMLRIKDTDDVPVVLCGNKVDLERNRYGLKNYLQALIDILEDKLLPMRVWSSRSAGAFPSSRPRRRLESMWRRRFTNWFESPLGMDPNTKS